MGDTVLRRAGRKSLGQIQRRRNGAASDWQDNAYSVHLRFRCASCVALAGLGKIDCCLSKWPRHSSLIRVTESSPCFGAAHSSGVAWKQGINYFFSVAALIQIHLIGESSPSCVKFRCIRLRPRCAPGSVPASREPGTVGAMGFRGRAGYCKPHLGFQNREHRARNLPLLHPTIAQVHPYL